MNAHDAHALLCADAFLQVHPLMPRVTSSICWTRQGVDKENTNWGTWTTKGAHWFTVCKHPESPHETIVYDHSTERTYVASMHAKLDKNMPPGTALLVQTTLDNGCEPKILVTDLVHPVIPNVLRRHEYLREISPFLPSVYHVQWTGQLDALEDFLAKPGALPHPAHYIITRHEDPLTLCLYKRIQDLHNPKNGKRARA